MRVVTKLSCRATSYRNQLFILSVAVLIVFLLSSCADKSPYQAEILWDTWGVPHIYADDPKGLFYAFGWAQMESHSDLLLRLIGQARGRAAEYWGEQHLESDKYIHTMGVPERSLEWYNAQRPYFREYLDAFVDGINSYADKHEGNISTEAKKVLPITGEDIFAHLQHVVHLTFIGRQVFPTIEQWSSLGSLAWAIAPARSAGGNAMLLANPHLPWSGMFRLFEAHLVTPDMNAYGATLVGFPLPVIAFNDHLGWTLTVNTLDGMDLYELTLSDEGYLFNGEVHAFKEKDQIIRIKKPDGEWRKEKLTLRQSIHGPALVRKEDKALAVRLVGLDSPFIIEQCWDMMRATNFVEFEAALQRMQLPFFNVIYADRDGHIMYLFAGHVPKRQDNSWDYWQNTVLGTDSTTLWTEIHAYEDLPRVVDPSTSWVQNANDPPWTSTFPMVLNPDDYPPYMSPRGLSLRAQRSIRLLTEDESISFDELIHYKHSTRMEMADRFLDDLIPAARKLGNDLAKQAADVLEAWDREADADSRGALLFAAWVPELETNVYAIPWSENAPLSTPDGLADPAAAVSALERVASNIMRDFGRLDVAWGDVHKLRYSNKVLPANGGPDWLGILRVLFLKRGGNGEHSSIYGDSYVSVVEFSEPIRAKALLSYGNASQTGSVHNGDQLELFAKKELRPVWRTREEVEAHLEKKKVF